MPPRDDIEVVPLSKDRVEGYLDLCERDDSVDPLYGGGRESRETRRARTLSRMRAPPRSPQAHLLAVRNGRVIGSGRAVVVPGCGDAAGKPATMSLLVSPDFRGQGVGTRLVDRLGEEMTSRGVDSMEIGVLDAWDGWRRFLEKLGFAPCERFADVVLRTGVPVHESPPPPDAPIRPIRLPEDREGVLDLYNGERAQDLPKACAVLPGQPAWWEVEPWASRLDPGGFLVAEDGTTGRIVGYASSNLVPGERPWGLIDYVDVEKRLLASGLREALLGRIVAWLRKGGAVDVRSRVHFGYRGEEELFRNTGFEFENRATVWRRSIARNEDSGPPR